MILGCMCVRESVGVCFFFFQAEDGIRDLVRSRGLGDVYKRQVFGSDAEQCYSAKSNSGQGCCAGTLRQLGSNRSSCLLYTSDAADERSSVDLGGSRIIKKKKTITR